MIKKRISHFLILEVLIAFFLIAMTVLPFSSYPYRAFQKELSSLETMEIEPYFTEGFLCALKQAGEDEFFLNEITIPFGKSDSLTLKRFVKIEKESEKTKRGTLVTINLTITSKNTNKTKKRQFYLPNLENNNAV